MRGREPRENVRMTMWCTCLNARAVSLSLAVALFALAQPAADDITSRHECREYDVTTKCMVFFRHEGKYSFSLLAFWPSCICSFRPCVFVDFGCLFLVNSINRQVVFGGAQPEIGLLSENDRQIKEFIH